MPKLPWKRGDAGSEQPPPLNTYLPSQPVDYTSLPVVEEESRLERFQRMPLPTRIGIIALPLLLLGVMVWGSTALLGSGPAPAPTPLPPPRVEVGEARVVNPDAIAIRGTTENVQDGTVVTATLLEDGTPIEWADPAQSTGVVQDDGIELRIPRSEAWQQPLRETAAYSVELTVGTDPPLVGGVEVTIPERFREQFLAGGAPEVTPTTEPTREAEPTTASTPTPSPTAEPPAPTAETGPPRVEAQAGATLLISPTLGSAVVATIPQARTYEPIRRTSDSQFFLVLEGNRTGWLPAGQANIDPAQAARVPDVRPPEEQVQGGTLRATVGNGGNIRFVPDRNMGTVLGQLHFGQSVRLVERTRDGQWYHVIAPEAEGWVSVSLLTIDPAVAAQVPVAQ